MMAVQENIHTSLLTHGKSMENAKGEGVEKGKVVKDRCEVGISGGVVGCKPINIL